MSSPQGSPCTLHSVPTRGKGGGGEEREGEGSGEGCQRAPQAPAMSLHTHLEVLTHHSGIAVSTVDSSFRTLIGHVLLNVASQHSLMTQITLHLLVTTFLQVGLEGRVRGGDG